MSDTCKTPDIIAFFNKTNLTESKKKVYNISKWGHKKMRRWMEIAKKKVFYTTFAALILSSFTLQTGKADEVQVKPDEAKIDYVNSEVSAP